MSAPPPPQPPPTSHASSASARHVAYLASLVAAREARLREDRRRKPGVRERLSSTYTLSQQVARAAGATGTNGPSDASTEPRGDRVSRERDAELSRSMPRVFSMLGGGSVDVVRSELQRRGWVENTNEWSSVWSLQWSIVGRVIQYGSLRPGQVVNHFQRAHGITSKSGLCKNIHLARLSDAEVADFFPRCFPVHVHDTEDLRDFRAQFRANAALNIAGRFMRAWRHEQGGTSAEDEKEVDEPLPVRDFDPQTLQLCIVALQAYLRSLRWIRDGLDNALPVLPAPPAEVPHDSDGIALTAWSTLTEPEWLRIERAAERIECDEKERFESAKRADQAQRTKGAAAAEAPPTTTDESTAASILSDPAEEEHREQDDDEVEEVELAALASAEATSPAASPDPSPSPSPVPPAGEESLDEEPSISNFSLLNRTPLPLDTIFAHLEHLYVELRVSDPQHFSLASSSVVHNLWIVKPGGLSRGRGIELLNSYDGLMRVLKGGGRWVVQRYIERPLVVFRKKFDLRQWVLLANFHQVQTIYFFSHDCYLRFSAEDYTPFAMDAMIHLTNNSIQKHSDAFDQLGFAKGQMWSTNEFARYLDAVRDTLPPVITAAHATGAAIWRHHIQSQMKRIASLAVSCGHESLDLRPNSFALFGFDYMLSSDLRPWLIEINSSPTLVGISIPGLVEGMVHDLAEVVLQDEWSPLSDTYRTKLETERARLAAIEASEAEAAAAAKEEKERAAAAAATAAAPAARRATLKPTSTARRPPRPTPTPNAAAGTASTAAASVASDPFLLPTPHPVGHRVGGFEVIESSFIGVIPKSHRAPPSSAPATSKTGAAAADTAISQEATKEGGALGRKDAEKKAPPTQPTGLFVTGKALPLPAVKSAATTTAAAAATSSRRRTLPVGATVAPSAVASRAKAK